MNALDQARLHTAALLHELPHLRALAGAGATAFPYPDWYMPDALPEEIVRRVAAAQAYAMGEESRDAMSGHDPQLRPILASLTGASTPLRLRPDPLRVDEGAFPVEGLDAAAFTAACRQRWDELCAAATALRDLEPSDYPERLSPLLEWQASKVPGPDGPRDLSWYARAHTRTAFALACADQPADRPQRLMLFGGELSGIQGFLYDIGSALAAKLLKGRSFYLHLLCDSIRRHILHELGQAECQTLVDSGGRFLLLLPAVGEERLDEIRGCLEEKLWDTHREKLGLHLAAVAFDPAALCQAHGLQRILDAWEAALQAARRRPMARLIARHPTRIFSPQGAGGAVRRDDLTGEELSPEDAVAIRDIAIADAEVQELRVSEATWLQLRLGVLLKGAERWCCSSTQPPEPDRDKWVQPLGLPVWHRLAHASAPRALHLPTGTRVRWINPCTLDEAAMGFTWYGGATFPLRADDEIATFDEIASVQASEEEQDRDGRGLVRLAHLRMDVDDLGQGLRRNQQSLVRYLANSRALDLFFKGHLEWLRRQPDYHAHTVLVYAGGDDLYAVGAWDTVVRWAMQVRTNLRRYTGGTALGLSGGVVLTGRRHPVGQAAQLAGEAEHAAKAHSHQGRCKDSLCLLGQPLRWGEEMPGLMALRDELEAYIHEEVFNQGLLQRLMRHHQDSLDQQGDGPELPLQRWHFTAAWDLVRYREVLDKRIHAAETAQRKQKTAVAEGDHELARLKAGRTFLEGHILELYNGPARRSNPEERIARLGIAARWAELRLRSSATTTSTINSTPQPLPR